MAVRKGSLAVAIFQAACTMRLQVKISDDKASIVKGLTNIIPGAEGGSRVFFNSSPPKSPDNRCDFCNKVLGKKDSGHVIDGNGVGDLLVRHSCGS